MILPLLMAGGLLAQDPAPTEPFVMPRIFTCSFEEAMRPPQVTPPQRIPFTWRPVPASASRAWLRFAMEVLANDSFDRWEEDPVVVRRAQGQPSWSGARIEPHRP